MILENIIVALAISLDAFFVTLFVSENAKIKLLILFLSPFFHMVFCSLGIVTQQSLKSFMGNAFLGIVVLIILIVGVYLFFVYKPEKEVFQKIQSMNKTCPYPGNTQEEKWFCSILIMLCSFDALIAGIIYGYWKVELKEAMLFVGGVNLAIVSLALLISGVVRYNHNT